MLLVLFLFLCALTKPALSSFDSGTLLTSLDARGHLAFLDWAVKSSSANDKIERWLADQLHAVSKELFEKYKAVLLKEGASSEEAAQTAFKLAVEYFALTKRNFRGRNQYAVKPTPPTVPALDPRVVKGQSVTHSVSPTTVSTATPSSAGPEASGKTAVSTSTTPPPPPPPPGGSFGRSVVAQQSQEKEEEPQNRFGVKLQALPPSSSDLLAALATHQLSSESFLTLTKEDHSAALEMFKDGTLHLDKNRADQRALFTKLRLAYFAMLFELASNPNIDLTLKTKILEWRQQKFSAAAPECYAILKQELITPKIPVAQIFLKMPVPGLVLITNAEGLNLLAECVRIFVLNPPSDNVSTHLGLYFARTLMQVINPLLRAKKLNDSITKVMRTIKEAKDTDYASEAALFKKLKISLDAKGFEQLTHMVNTTLKAPTKEMTALRLLASILTKHWDDFKVPPLTLGKRLEKALNKYKHSRQYVATKRVLDAATTKTDTLAPVDIKLCAQVLASYALMAQLLPRSSDDLISEYAFGMFDAYSQNTSTQFTKIEATYNFVDKELSRLLSFQPNTKALQLMLGMT